MNGEFYQPELWLTQQGQQSYAKSMDNGEGQPQQPQETEDERRAREAHDAEEARKTHERDQQRQRDDQLLNQQQNRQLLQRGQEIIDRVNNQNLTPQEANRQLQDLLRGQSADVQQAVYRKLSSENQAQQAQQAPQPRTEQPIDAKNVQDPTAKLLIDIYNERIAEGDSSMQSYQDLYNKLLDRVVDPAVSAGEKNAIRGVMNSIQKRIDEQQQQEGAKQSFQRELGRFAEALSGKDSLEVYKIGRKQESELNADDRETLDRIFNQLFSSADNNPGQEWSQAFDQLYDAPKVKAFIAFLEEHKFSFSQRYANEYQMRQVLHNANYVVGGMRDTKQLSQFLQGFQVEFADLALSKVGVSTAMHLYDQALRRIQAENGGFIPQLAITGNPITGEGSIDQRVRNQLLDLIKSGVVRGQDGKDLQDWEVRRAMAFARGMGVAFGTTLEVLAQTKLPPGTELGSVYAQDIIKHLAPFQHVVGKFGVGVENLAVLGYKLSTGKHFWSPKELLDFKNKKDDLVNRAFNGFLDEGDERLIGDKNPLRIGGLFSKTGWRIGEPNEINPLSALINFRFSSDPNIDESGVIGTGIRIEQLRAKLEDHDHAVSHAAQVKLRAIMHDILARSPLKLFYNDLANDDPKKRAGLKKYMDKLGIKDIRQGIGSQKEVETLQMLIDRNPWLAQALDDVTFLQEATTRLVKDEKSGKKHFNKEELDFTDIHGKATRKMKDGTTKTFTEEQRREYAEKLVRAIREGFRGHNDEGLNHFIEDFAHHSQRQPFIFGTEDIPYEEYNFTNLGGTAIARRWRDIQAAVEAADGIGGFLSNMQAFKGDPHKIIGEFRKIYSSMTMYDPTAARSFTTKMAKGIIRYYERAWWTQIPVLEYFTGRMKSSYAQLALGQEQAAWDVRAKNIFIEELFDNAMITHHQAQELMDGTAATKPFVFYELGKKLAPIIALGLAIYLLSRALKDTK